MNEGLIQQAKVWAADPTKLPLLFDALRAEADRAIDGMRAGGFEAEKVPYSAEELARRLTAYEGLTDDLARVVALVTHWSDEAGGRVVGRLIGRLANALGRTTGTGPWLALDRYPALLVLYAAGLGAVVGGRESLLAPILAGPFTVDQNRWKSNVVVLYPQNVIDHRHAQQLPGLDRRHTPVSDHLIDVARPWLAELEPDQRAQERAFDRFELLLGLVMYDLSGQQGHGGWAPIGSFWWRYRYGDTIWDDLASEIDVAGENWPLLKAGLFGASSQRLAESLKGYLALVTRAANGAM